MDVAAMAKGMGAAWIAVVIVLFAGVAFWAFRPKRRPPRRDPPPPFGDG